MLEFKFTAICVDFGISKSKLSSNWNKHKSWINFLGITIWYEHLSSQLSQRLKYLELMQVFVT